MTRRRWRFVLLLLALPLVAAAAAEQGPTLTVDSPEVQPGLPVTLTGRGFVDCVSDGVDTDAGRPVRISSGRLGFPDGVLDARGDFAVTTTVPADARPTAYRITARCASLSGPGDVSRTVRLVVVAPDVAVDPGDPDPGDPDVAVDPGGQQVRPGQVTVPDPGGSGPDQVTGPDTTVASVAAGVGVAALVAILALVVTRGVQRRRISTASQPSVHVVSRRGVAVGPTVDRRIPGAPDLRVVPRPDPGRRALHEPGGRP